MVRIFFLPYLGNRSKSDPCSYERFCLESHILSFHKVLQIPPESLCMEINCVGFVFGNRCTYWQNLVAWGFISSFMLIYRLVCQNGLYFEQTAGSEKNYCKNTGVYLVVWLLKIILF